MQTGLLLSSGTLSLSHSIPLPALLAGEVLIRIHLAGICSTDAHLKNGYKDSREALVLGHEFCGVVVVEGDGEGKRGKGRRVVGSINVKMCKETCEPCKRFLKGTHCVDREVLGIVGRNGAFAQFVALPQENLVEIPDDVPDDLAVFAEPVAAAFRVVEQMEQKINSETNALINTRVAILGDGKLGLLLSCAIKYAFPSSKIVVFGKHENKLNRFKKSSIAVCEIDSINSEQPFPIKYNAHFDFVVDATGSPSGFEFAIKLVRSVGTIVLKTTCAIQHGNDCSLSVKGSNEIVVREIAVLGSRCGPLDRALAFLSSSAGSELRDKMDVLVVKLSKAENAIDLACDGSGRKILIDALG